MKRRHFINLLPCLPAICSTSWSQRPGQERRIGALLLFNDDAAGRSRFAAFEGRLKELGWSADNIRIDIRWAGDDAQKTQAYAAELVQSRPDAILAHGTEGVAALAKLTSTTPLVFVQVTDPVKAGFIKSLSSPGGNVTGLANFGGAVGGERLDLLKGLAPHVRRVLVLYEADYPALPDLFAATRREASAIGVQLTEDGVRDAVQLERDITNFGRKPNGGMLVVQSPFTTSQSKKIVELAANNRIPAVYPLASFTDAGGLVSYGVNVTKLWRAAAGYIDRILRGANPRDLPVVEPTEPEIILNHKAATALGLEIPPSLRARITRMLE